MNLALARLARKRMLLIEKSTVLREQLELYIEDLRQPINTADKGLSIFRFIKLHPLLMLGGSITLHQFRTRFFSKWINQLITLSHVSQLLKRLF
jgi:YqjK-like protein